MTPLRTEGDLFQNNTLMAIHNYLSFYFLSYVFNLLMSPMSFMRSVLLKPQIVFSHEIGLSASCILETFPFSNVVQCAAKINEAVRKLKTGDFHTLYHMSL